MPIKLMFITNDSKLAKIADDAGVDWIFVDLEIYGKEQRQRQKDTVISQHKSEDVKKIKTAIKRAELLVRVNPIFSDSKHEINKVIDDGADIVMLPYFKTKSEVEAFIGYVNGKAKTCLLYETSEAVKNIDSILAVPGIDLIHIGLNDLSIAYDMKFVFEPLAEGLVDMLAGKFKQSGIPYGFGGIARVGQGELLADYILAEHYRLGSGMAILARSFFNAKNAHDVIHATKIFKNGINEIRKLEAGFENKDELFFENNHRLVRKKVAQLISNGW